MNGYNLQYNQSKVVHEDKVSKIGQFGTLTGSPVSPDSGTTMPEKSRNYTLLLSK